MWVSPPSDVVDTEFSQAHRDMLQLLGHVHLHNGHPQKAAVIFEVLTELLPQQSQLKLCLARALLLAGDELNALRTLQNFPEEAGNQAVCWLMRGQALSRLGRVAEAAGAMRMFIRFRRLETVKE
jgi:predicted Zn-dependent protease